MESQSENEIIAFWSVSENDIVNEGKSLKHVNVNSRKKIYKKNKIIEGKMPWSFSMEKIRTKSD